MISHRNSIHNQKAKLAVDYNDLLKELSSPKMSVVGCYVIGETIGEGTYGKVKMGHHQFTGQRVAIKKISKQHAPLMAREIHHHRQLRHPNIVMLYEVLTTETAIFIVCEYCPNGELFDLLTQSGRFSEHQAQKYFGQLMSAVKHCHDRGIVHRDLKLENILLDAEFNAKICDFGFARQADDRQFLETFCGSLAYSAPEVLKRQRYTGPETDIWCLGIILYTLLAGELPFDDDSEIVIERKIKNLEYQIPTYFSSEAKDLIENILRLDPKERLTIDEILRHPWVLKECEDHHTVDDEVDYESGPSTRNSMYSDADSLFSSAMMDDDLDSHTTASSPRSSYISPQWASFSSSKRNAVIPPPRQQPVFASLDRLGTCAEARPLRFSAPTMNNRTRMSGVNGFSSGRQSMPNAFAPGNLRDTTYGKQPSMAPMEQRLFSALTAAGFDENTVRDMRSDSGNVLGTLWHMLMENLSKNQDSANKHMQPEKLPSDTTCSPIDKAIQTDRDVSTETTQIHTTRSPAGQSPNDTPSTPFIVPVPVPVPAPSSTRLTPVNHAATRTLSGQATTGDKSGWLASVKTWFSSPKQVNSRDVSATSFPSTRSGYSDSSPQRHGMEPSVTTRRAMMSALASPMPPAPGLPVIAPPPVAHNRPSRDSDYKASNAFGNAKPPICLTALRPVADNYPISIAKPQTPDIPAKPATQAATATQTHPAAQTKPATEVVPPPVTDAPAKETTMRDPCPLTATNTAPDYTQTAFHDVITVPPAMDDDSDDDSTVGSSPATSVSSVEDVQPSLDVTRKPIPARSWPLAMREAPMKRFDCPPARSRLSSYSAFDGGQRQPLGAKIIIEEEEEEEE